MTIRTRDVKFPHRVVAVEDITLGDGHTVLKGTRGWLISYSSPVIPEPNVHFDGYGFAGINAEHIKAIRIRGHLMRKLPPMDDGDGLLTCKVCEDRYTTNKDGVCGHCKQQAWIDAHG